MSKIKVNTIAPRSGSTVTLGESGDTITLGCGASQSGFGRTGTVDWCTTAKTSPLTAVSGKGYFVNTCGGAITVTLPSSPSAGDIVALKDYAGTWDNNYVTVGRNGSKINGECYCSALKTQGQSVTLIYVDGTKGWQDIHDSTSDVTGQSFVAATGGNATLTVGDYKTHIFTSNGCFQVTNAGTPSGSTAIEYLVVGGGGSGGAGRAGGGGAGGFRSYMTGPGCNSPLNAPAAITASVATFPITIGGGAAAVPSSPNQVGASGTASTFSTISSAGGGGGGQDGNAGLNGGSGGGGGESSLNSNIGSGNTPPVSPPQGNPGGASTWSPPTGGPHPTSPAPYAGGGGGGAGEQGNRLAPGGPGGDGSYIGDGNIGPTAPSYGTTGPVSGTRYFAGGGAGMGCASGSPGATSPGGSGGGGTSPGPGTAGAATANTGGGGGAYGNTGGGGSSGAGGSGIVILRYKFQ